MTDFDDWCSFFFFICSIVRPGRKLEPNLSPPLGKSKFLHFSLFTNEIKRFGFSPISKQIFMPQTTPTNPEMNESECICYGISLEFWENGVTAPVWARGPDRNAPEASVGLPLGHGDQSLIPPERAGGLFPAPSTKKSAPYDSKRADPDAGPWKHWAFTTLHFQRTKVLLVI